MHGSIPSNNRECRWDNVVCMALYSHKFFLSSYWTCIFTVVSRNVSHKSRNLCIQNIYSRKQILHRSYRQIKIVKYSTVIIRLMFRKRANNMHETNNTFCVNSPDNYRPRFFAKYCGNTRNSKVIIVICSGTSGIYARSEKMLLGQWCETSSWRGKKAR